MREPSEPMLTHSIENVTRIIALIGLEKCDDGSLPSGAHGGGWEGLGLDGGETAL